MSRRAVSLFDVPVDLGSMAEILDTVIAWTGERRSRRVMYVNAHVFNQAARNPALDTALRRADLVYCDGHGVRLAARLLGRRAPPRMTGADWIDELAPRCVEAGRSLYLLGGAPGEAREAGRRLASAYPGLRIAGAHHGFDPPGPELVAATGADIVLVGMGSPRQELWVDRHADALDGAVAWTVGALFGYVTERIPRGPQWMTDRGLEWAVRLALEPRRLWRRYLIGNPAFLIRASARRRRRAR